MNTPEFLFAVLALLLTPGPTNTLLALSGADRGFGRSLAAIPAEAAGYLLVAVPLAAFGAGLLDVSPLLGNAMRLGAAVWVMLLATRLWRPGKADVAKGLVTPGRVFVTTLLNPKALVFGLVLLPRPDSPDFLPHLLLFCGVLLAAAVIWVAAGTVLTRSRPERGLPQLLCRTAACWLAVLSVGLLVGTLRA